jgi:hypothetical protein
MKPNVTMRTALLAGLVGLPFATVPAAGPFQVRRATAPQAVAGAAPLAIVAVAPFDVDAASSMNATSYYYGVYDAQGQALSISVQTNPVTHSIRIGFDDGNPASAPVDAGASTVVVAPPTIQANGLQVAAITIVPKDASGMRLGMGLFLALDPTMLWPAHLAGPVVDMGDGTYAASAVSSIPGTGTVRVVVEGVPLSPLPTITATAVDSSLSLRDLAIEQLRDFASGGGPLAALATSAGAGSPQAKAIAAAMAQAGNAVATLANDDPTRDDNVLKGELDSILSTLSQVLDAPGALNPLDVRDAMNDIVGAVRMIAVWHIERASDACGACSGAGSSKKVCNAVSQLEIGDAMRASADPDWGGIADAYARAVEWALQAYHNC